MDPVSSSSLTGLGSKDLRYLRPSSPSATTFEYAFISLWEARAISSYYSCLISISPSVYASASGNYKGDLCFYYSFGTNGSWTFALNLS